MSDVVCDFRADKTVAACTAVWEVILQPASGFFGTSNSSMPSWARVSTPPHCMMKLLSRTNKSEAIRSVQMVNTEIQQNNDRYLPSMSAGNADLRRLIQRSNLKYADLYGKSSSGQRTKMYKATPSRLRVMRAPLIPSIIERVCETWKLYVPQSGR